MATTTTETPEALSSCHPVLEFARRGRARLDHLHSSAARPVWAMTTQELGEAARDLARMAAQLEALRLGVLAEAERHGQVAAPGDRNAADWLARHTGQRRTAARADLRLALSLEADHPTLQATLAAGEVSGEQVRVIKRYLDLLPTTGDFAVDPAQRAEAEAHLVALAPHHDLAALEVLGRRIYAVVSPEAAEAYEGRILEAQEARAARKVVLETWTDHQGITHGRFRIPQLHGAMLKKALEAIMSPARVSTSSTTEGAGSTNEGAGSTNEGAGSTNEDAGLDTSRRDLRPRPVRRGEALCELLERLTDRDLPTTGGGGATVVVTLTHDQLTDMLQRAGVATLDTGTRISAGEARRLACQHRLLPAVLGGASIPLDLGRTQRLHNKAQRLAMTIRDGGCTAEHCEVPASMCQAHHDHPWSEGGPTDLITSRMLCGPHHRRLHDPAYGHRLTADNKIQFYRRL